MPRLPRNARVIFNNRLIIVWRLANGDCRAQGKRVARNCPLNAAERHMYVSELGRSAICVKRLMDMRQCSLRDAWEAIKAAR